MCVHVKELKQIPHQDVGNDFVCMVGFGGDSYLKKPTCSVLKRQFIMRTYYFNYQQAPLCPYIHACFEEIKMKFFTTFKISIFMSIRAASYFKL